MVLFHENKVIVAYDRYLWTVKAIAQYIPSDSVFFLVEASVKRVFTSELDINITNTLSAECRSLRSLIFSDMNSEFVLVGKANQIIDWSKSHKYCGS